jgi:hypothetical protein
MGCERGELNMTILLEIGTFLALSIVVGILATYFWTDGGEL